MNVYAISNVKFISVEPGVHILCLTQRCVSPHPPILSCYLLILLSPALPRPFPTPGPGGAAHVSVVNWQPSGVHPHKIPL